MIRSRIQEILCDEKYNDKLLIILTDNYLEKNGIKKQIGVEIANMAHQQHPNLPVLIQSSEPIEKDKIKSEKTLVISKTSHT